jgi:hypothetical protein
MKFSRFFFSLLVLALLAIPCRADGDSSYFVTDYADFLVGGQAIDFSYAYQLSVNPDGETVGVTDLQVFVSSGQWVNESPANTAAVYLYDGSLEFASELITLLPQQGVINNYGVFVDQDLIGLNFGSDYVSPPFAFSWNATPIESQVPEPSGLFTLTVGLLGLAALKLKLA